MNIISTYREVGTYRAAAELCGITHKTVKRVVDRAEAGGAPEPRPRPRNFDQVRDLVAERVAKSGGRISAKRLLPIAQAPAMRGRRVTSVAWWLSRKRCGGKTIIEAAARRCGQPVSIW
jgi:hypothetical protein